MPFTAALFRLPVVVIVAALSLSGPAVAQDGENYIISSEDGYGIVECMHSGSACGHVIADSWCESHGHAHALAFGVGGDVTGSIDGGNSLVKVADGDVVIRCGS